MVATVERTELVSEIAANWQALEELANQLGNGVRMPYVCKTIEQSRQNAHGKTTEASRWYVSLFIGDKCYGEIAPTFGEARLMLEKKMRSELFKCPVCGGRTDGDCKHSH